MVTLRSTTLELGGGKTAIVVPREHLKATLEVSVAAVEACEFDAKIQQHQAAIRSRLVNNRRESANP
jgi:hypothetical protein